MKRYSTLWFICALCLHITLAQSPFEPAQVVYRCDPQEYIVSTSDIEGDQDIDIIVAISNFGSLFWYENLGDGSMSARKAIHQGQENITALTSGLLDQDQDADVLFATASPSAIQVLRNNGGGASFSPTQEIGVSGTVHSLIMVDLDGDQDNDLVWTTSANGTIAAAFNDGGIIGAPVVLWELEGARHLRAADMDGDGDMDMICSSSVSGDISVLLNDGGGLFDTWMDIGASVADPWWFDVADLRADGDPDIIAPGGGITWFDNQSGTAGFVPRTVYQCSSNEHHAFACSNNDDGLTGIAFTYTYVTNQQIEVCSATRAWIQEGDQYVVYGGNEFPCWNMPLGAVVDLDDDGKLDLVETLPQFNRIGWRPLISSVLAAMHPIEGDAFMLLHQLHVADMDLDGDIDVIPIGYGDRVVWFANDGTGSFSPRYGAFRSDDDANACTVSDLNGDLLPDYLYRTYSDGDVFWARNGAADGFEHMGVAAPVEEWTAAFVAGDLDGDGDNDLLVCPPSNVWGTELHWLENDGAGQFSVTHMVGEAPNAQVMFIQDMNNDGLNDIVCPLYYYPAGIAIYLAESPGVFPAVAEITLVGDGSSTLSIPVCADLDGDGDLDLIAHCSLPNSTYRIIPFLNDGSGTLASGESIPVSWAINLKSIAIGDFDGDQVVDLVYGESDLRRVRFFHGTGNAEFSEPVLVDSTSQTRPGAMSAADIDMDGDLDLVVVHTAPSEIVWYENSLIATSIDQPDLRTLGFAPNPMTDHTRLTLPRSMVQPLRVDVFDGLGKEIRSTSITSAQEVRMERNALPSGLYTVRVVDKNHITTYGRLMID